MMFILTFCLFFLTSLKSFCFGFELFSGTATALGVGALSATYATFNYLKCRNSECCDDEWIPNDVLMLRENLKNNLFGQHLAEEVIYKSLQGYLRNKNPNKPLVMAFHGLTGSGKNYAAQIIANSLYKKGMDSEFVHVYYGSKIFPHKHEVSKYRDLLRKDIPQYTEKCSRSLFIFDEIDKMPPGTLDALKPFIDYYGNIDNVDFRKNIFIFLSNSGSTDIMKIALNFWADGREREDITMKDIEPLIIRGAFNENGGFQFSELLRSDLIDVFIPFLPLEKEHVEKCIEVEVKKYGNPHIKTLVKTIADELVYFPSDIEIFSKSGCKRIEAKVYRFLD